MTLFLGIDGGATRATALVTDAAGVELARVPGEPGLVRAENPEAAAPGLTHLARLALRQAGAGGAGGQRSPGAAAPAAALCCALAGAGRPAERRALENTLRKAGVARRVRVVTDAEAALEDAFGGGPGLLLIAGTGSIAWGRAADGRTARAGGWGALLGDEGSGYALGLEALRAVARAHDGRGPDTQLLEPVLRAAGAADPESLIHWAATAAKAEIAALAPLVAAVAASPDAVAAGILDQAAHDLARHIAALHRRLGPWPAPAPVALAGGLLAPGRPLRQPVLRALEALQLPLAILDRPVDAARGAATLARRFGA